MLPPNLFNESFNFLNVKSQQDQKKFNCIQFIYNNNKIYMSLLKLALSMLKLLYACSIVNISLECMIISYSHFTLYHIITVQYFVNDEK